MKGGDAKQQNTKKKGGENNELHQKKLVFALAHHITIWLQMNATIANVTNTGIIPIFSTIFWN